MKKDFLRRAVKNNYRIYRNSHNRLSLEAFPGLKKRLQIEEQESGRWLIISDQIPQTILATEDLLEILEALNQELQKMPSVS